MIPSCAASRWRSAGAQRGVVAAASYEARKFGVRSAMPSATAQRQCPELVFVKPRFDVYKEVSRQIREIFLDYTPLVEPLSLDEAYLDVTEQPQGHAAGQRIAREIRARILERTGLTASAGISYNKFLAKLASDHRKPNGQSVIPPEKGPAFVEGLPVAKFHGVGPKTAEKMNRLGIHNGVDLKAQSLEFLEEYFGKAGAYYYAIARGQDDRRVCPTGRVNRSARRPPSCRILAGRPRSRKALPRCWKMSGPTASAPARPAAPSR